MKINVMVDLETLGTRPGCKVMSIGAVVFSPEGVSDTQRFNAIISRHAQPPSLHEDVATLMWWSQQSKEAKDRLFGDNVAAHAMPYVLADFSLWLKNLGGEVLVWGNGADFDNPILSTAYNACHIAQPWGSWNGRCYRTLKNLRPEIKLVRSGLHHDALDDAISQATHAVNILNAISGWEMQRNVATTTAVTA